MPHERTVRFFEVFWNDGSGGGPAADGSRIARFARRSDAEAFAAGKLAGYGGGPAEVREDEAPLRLARRWGVA